MENPHELCHPVETEAEPTPPWFGALRKRERLIEEHDMKAIRASIARGIVEEREP